MSFQENETRLFFKLSAKSVQVGFCPGSQSARKAKSEIVIAL